MADGLGSSGAPNRTVPWEPIAAAIRAPAELPHNEYSVVAHTKSVGVSENVGDGRRQILCCNAAALTRAVFQDECVISAVADLDSVRETLVQRPDIGKSTARRNDGEGRFGLPRKKNKPVFSRVGSACFCALV